MHKNINLTWPMYMFEKDDSLMIVRNTKKSRPIVWRDSIKTEIPNNMSMFDFVEHVKELGWKFC